jgi:hypothetical protein
VKEAKGGAATESEEERKFADYPDICCPRNGGNRCHRSIRKRCP